MNAATARVADAHTELPQTPSFRLDGRRALITGAGRGIGLAAAVALADAGAHVTLAARSEEELRQSCAAIRAKGNACDYIALDVTDAQAVTQAVGERAPFHILVNSAGMNRPKELTDLSDADICAVLDLNVKATFYVTGVQATSYPITSLFDVFFNEPIKPSSVLANGSQFGLCQIYANEIWHFELAVDAQGNCPRLKPNAAG